MLAALETTTDRPVANDNADGLRRIPAPSSADGWIDGFDRRVEAWLLARSAKAVAVEGIDVAEKSERAIRRACIRSALLGAVSGVTSTVAAVIAVETGGAGLAVAAPAAAMVAAAEVTARAALHVELAATLATVHGDDADASGPFGRALLADLLRAEAVEDARKLAVVSEAANAGGRELAANLRTSAIRRSREAARGMIPVLGIALASWDAWRGTRRAGDAMLRRLQRAN